MIKTTKLTKYYNKNARGILDVTLDIKKGEIFGFIGPNGAGKSTTVRTILNLIFPTSGKATVNGLDCVTDSVEIRDLVGYIPGEVHFYGDMIVSEFLEYAAKFTNRPYKKRQAELIEKLELDVSRKIEDLSLGNKKKVAIVQALQTSPKILILDEPTSGLDPLMQNTFFTIIKEEKKQGTTIFFSSHILKEVQEICDRVGIIKEGRLIQVETVEEIMQARAKRVRIKTSDTIKETDVFVDVIKNNGYMSFVYTGKINDLLQKLEKIDLQDLTITEPSLEEIFMHYYEREETK
ncbi:MAG: ABC transporter ATP-binding protein [Candidatus Izimaplasma sp.]|nr:ABC transporter ATP-binding protein [Candidatus Izimaplasma bacterium]